MDLTHSSAMLICYEQIFFFLNFDFFFSQKIKCIMLSCFCGQCF